MTVISAITSTISEMFTWMSTALTDLIPIFYNSESGLTFFGVLAIVALAISIFFLIMGLIQNFLHLRG